MVMLIHILSTLIQKYYLEFIRMKICLECLVFQQASVRAKALTSYTEDETITIALLIVCIKDHSINCQGVC